MINGLPFYFEPSGRDIVQAWLDDEENIVPTYLEIIAFDHPRIVAPFLFDCFVLTLEGNPCCDLEFWLNSS